MGTTKPDQSSFKPKKLTKSTNMRIQNIFSILVLPSITLSKECDTKPEKGCEVNLAPENTFLPPVGVISFAGSGNTWFRTMFEKYTGIYTGSVYTSKILYQSGMVGEMEDLKKGNVLTVKTHLTQNKNSPAYKKNSWLKNNTAACIYMIRNPKDALFSLMNNQFGREINPEKYKLMKFDFRGICEEGNKFYDY